MKSESFKLSPQILTLLENNGIKIATPVQKEIIPAIISGKDVLAQSETGSGKTISFAIPIIETVSRKDGLCALILVPTRELCNQVSNEFVKFSRGKHLGILPVYGGVSISGQISKIRTTNIVIATPGRLMDLMDRRVLKLDKIRFLVFDEADRMLDMGFLPDIEKILKQIPPERQTMLFSATIPEEIAKLSKKYLKSPVRVSFEKEVKKEFLHQTYYQTTKEKKLPLLVHLLRKERDLALIFCNRKHITSKLAKKLTDEGINAKCLHGDMTQNNREKVTRDFKKKLFNVLIATDVASRGLHIEDISHVYNYEIPKDVDSYTHRIGRTARAGKKGEAISFVTPGEDQKFFKQILFEHKGSISLKYEDDVHYPKISLTKPEPDKKKSNFEHKKRDEQSSSRFEHKKRDKKTGGKFEYKKRDEKSGSKFGFKKRDEQSGSRFGHKKRDEKTASRFEHKKRDEKSGSRFEYKNRDEKTGSRFGQKKRDEKPVGSFEYKKREEKFGNKFGQKRRDTGSKFGSIKRDDGKAKHSSRTDKEKLYSKKNQ